MDNIRLHPLFALLATEFKLQGFDAPEPAIERLTHLLVQDGIDYTADVAFASAAVAGYRAALESMLTQAPKPANTKRHRWVRVVGRGSGLSGGLTWLLLSQNNDHVIPEWRLIGQVGYRQVYAAQDPRWYVWTFHVPTNHISMKDRTFPSMEMGMEFVEQYHGLAHAEIDIVYDR